MALRKPNENIEIESEVDTWDVMLVELKISDQFTDSKVTIWAFRSDREPEVDKDTISVDEQAMPSRRELNHSL